MAFQGALILGDGFTLDRADALALIKNDARNKNVLFPYVNGHDVSSRPDSSGDRWVINFRDWPMDRAATYPECFEHVRLLVQPERAKKDPIRYPTMVSEWWKFWRPRRELYSRIADLDRVVVIARVSKVVAPVMAPTGQVFSDATVVFASDDPAMLALLSSAPHYWWAISRASTMKGDLRYTPTDVFETLARPGLTDELRGLGERLDSFRREDVMLARGIGLTTTYNLVHDPSCGDADITELRRIHVNIDHAVVRAYGWDISLDHDFHQTDQGVRFTLGPETRREVLDHLLEENRRRYTNEKEGKRTFKQDPIL